MQEHTCQQIRVISCRDPDEFQRTFNEAMQELASSNPDVKFNTTMGHCAYITYKKTTYVPETAEDEFAQIGISYRCRNCPEFKWHLNQDGSITRTQKRGGCRISKYGTTSSDTHACEYLYRSILQGRAQAIPDDDLEDFQLR